MMLAQLTVAELNTRVVAIAMAWIGLLLGSFATVVIHRLPTNEQIVKGRSHCSSCKKTLSFIDLIPLVSWLIFRGRCRHCHAQVSFIYPLTEIAAASIASAVCSPFIGCPSLCHGICRSAYAMRAVPSLLISI
jgi:prepilin signal peptidase PulO-like enzyme (type II secretory pathway)